MRAHLNRLRLILLVLALALGSSSCSNKSRFQVGYAEFWVEFADRVVDWTGRVQIAYCGRYLVFVGDIDTACSSFPMVWSYGQDAWVECTYLDSFGQRWYYTDLFYFWPGYIQEPACFDGYDFPAEDPNPDRNQSSEIDRDETGQVLLSELPAGAEEISLAEGDMDIGALRDSLRQRLDSAVPARLPEGELADEPIRNTESHLGEPPPELVDPDASRTSQSELPRDERGRLLVDQELGPSAETANLQELRELLGQGRGGLPLPEELNTDSLSEPVRQSESTLGSPAEEPSED